MPVTTTEPIEIRGSRASDLHVRSTPTVPTILGGLIAVGTIITRMSTGHDLAEIYALAFVASTAGLGFALDDPAAETVAASPTPLARRRIHRVAIVGAITAATWLVIAAVVATSDTQRFPTYDVIIEVAALAAIGLATSATVQLADYLDRQVGVVHLRDREMPNSPWPGRDNPMLTYLVHRAEEMAITDGRPAATIWLAVHARFEGAIEALATNPGRSEAPPRRPHSSHALPNQDEN